MMSADARDKQRAAMDGYSIDTYGDRIADLYDDWSPGILVTGACVEKLATLAAGGPILELGVGTGRLAIPLAERGLEVVGIDSSSAMLERLRAKPGGHRVRTHLGNFADVDVEGLFSLAVVAADTLFMLSSQEEQVSCFLNVAQHLAPGAFFVVEAFAPNRTRYAAGQDVVVRRVTADSVILGVGSHDPAVQRIDAQQILLEPTGIRMVPGVLRYAWPAELDLMARLAGMRLNNRWGSWRGDSFTAASPSHVSTYQRD
jgi:SAM-dependent methyltransferase